MLKLLTRARVLKISIPKIYMFQAIPFIIEAYTDHCDAKLKVVALEAGGNQAEQAPCDVAINNVSSE